MRKDRHFTKFEDWHSHDVQEKLGYSFDKKSQSIKEWTKVEGEIDPLYQPHIEKMRLKLCDYHASWNETELMMMFIGPFLNTIDFEGKGFNIFYERFFTAKIGELTIKGSVDSIVSKGTYNPIAPYFFIHLYKRFKMNDSDPLGQLLISMIAAQTENANNNPITGCYIYGSIWNFVLIEGKTYASSQGYDATDSEKIKTIWLILNKTKAIIKGLIEKEALQSQT